MNDTKGNMNDTSYLQNCLDRLKAGDDAARNDLINCASERLRQIAHTMLGDFQRLKRWEDTDDILQNAMLRLCHTLRKVAPASLRDFYGLVTLQIRRELIDLSRHHFGPEGRGAKHATNHPHASDNGANSPLYEQSDSSTEPGSLASWSEFHQHAGALPKEEQEVFDLIWYQGLKHVEAAALLNVSAKTIKRRWHAACLQLHAALQGHLPGS